MHEYALQLQPVRKFFPTHYILRSVIRIHNSIYIFPLSCNRMKIVYSKECWRRPVPEIEMRLPGSKIVYSKECWRRPVPEIEMRLPGYLSILNKNHGRIRCKCYRAWLRFISNIDIICF
jgi:hypothetical protein